MINRALEMVHKPIESQGGYTPISRYIKDEGEVGNGYIKKTIVNKLGEKKTIFVKKGKKKKDDPCWDGYEQVGMKTKNGKQVPNCVPKK